MKSFQSYLDEKSEVRPTICYVDMDGVIFDFEREVKNRVGKTPEQIGQKKFSDEFKDVLIDDGLFETMPPMKDGARLLQFCVDNFDVVKILSSTGHYQHELVSQQKRAHFKKHYGKFAGRIEIITVRKSHNKAEYARPDAVLIDDREKSTKPFKSAGGQVVLHKNAASTIKQLKKMLINEGLKEMLAIA